MRYRLACSLLVSFVVAAPVLRVMCDVDCLTPRAVAAAGVDGHCAEHENAPPTPAPADRCHHGHGATFTTQAAAKTQLSVPAHAEFTDRSALLTAIPPAPAGTADAAAESPPLSHQTPLRI